MIDKLLWWDKLNTELSSYCKANKINKNMSRNVESGPQISESEGISAEKEVFGEIGGRESLEKYIRECDSAVAGFKERLGGDIKENERLEIETVLMATYAGKAYLELIAPRVEKGENIKNLIAEDCKKLTEDREKPETRKLGLERRQVLSEDYRTFREIARRQVEALIKSETLRREDSEKT